MSYDPRCEDLARFFLTDNGITTDANAKELAQEIQDVIESYLQAVERGLVLDIPAFLRKNAD